MNDTLPWRDLDAGGSSLRLFHSRTRSPTTLITAECNGPHFVPIHKDHLGARVVTIVLLK